MNFGIQLWMYITPVVYPISTLEPGTLRTLISLNPVTCGVEAFRWAFLGVGQLDVLGWLISTAVTAAILFVGLIVFGRVEKTFMDTV